MKGNLHLNESAHRQTKKRAQLWLWPNLLSLDAPVIALLWQILFVRCFHASMGLPAALLLVLAVWLIYAADRMLDAWRGVARTQRHVFYLHHWRVVMPLWVAIFGVCAWLAWTQLSPALWMQGLAITTGAGIYLAAVHGLPRIWRAGLKEAAVGIVFALGVSLAAWPMVRTGADVLAVVLFCGLCWINCVGIEDWEQASKLRASAIYAAAGVAMMALVLARHRPVLACAETASALGLILIDRYCRRISADAIRVLADAVLLTPLLFLNIAGKVS